MRSKKMMPLLALLLPFSLILSECSKSEDKQVKEPQPPKEEVHLGEMMGQLQYYTLKLGLAMQHKNGRLANFYLNEVNETYADIISKNVVNSGVNISSLMKQILESKQQKLATVIAADDTANFKSSFHALIMSCNNCHIETNHNFIVIEEPHENYNGQDFDVHHSLYSE